MGNFFGIRYLSPNETNEYFLNSSSEIFLNSILIQVKPYFKKKFTFKMNKQKMPIKLN